METLQKGMDRLTELVQHRGGASSVGAVKGEAECERRGARGRFLPSMALGELAAARENTARLEEQMRDAESRRVGRLLDSMCRKEKEEVHKEAERQQRRQPDRRKQPQQPQQEERQDAPAAD